MLAKVQGRLDYPLTLTYQADGIVCWGLLSQYAQALSNNPPSALMNE